MKIKEFFSSPMDPESVPADWWLERYRNWRAEELKATDWTQLPDASADSAAWAIYRQALRDLPAQGGKAEDAEFPVAP